MKPNVDKELLPMKAHYFLFNAGTAPVVPFMPTLARQLGFSSVIVGTMYTVLPIVGMLAKPFFGFIADRYQKHRFLFLMAQLLTAIAFFCIMFIPAIPQPKPVVELHCHAGVSELRFCSDLDKCIDSNLDNRYGNSSLKCNLRCQADTWMWDIVCNDWLNNTQDCPKLNPNLDLTIETNMSHTLIEKQCLFFKVQHDRAELNGQNIIMDCPSNKKYFNTTCEMDCHDEYIQSTLSESPVIKSSDAFGLYQFWLFFLMLIFSWIGMAVVVSVGDAICFGLLGDRHHLYGKQRLWGAVGWGIVALLSGYLVDKLSGNSVNKNYTIVFWMTAIIIGFDMFVSTKLKFTQTTLSKNIFKDVSKLFLSVRVVVFFVWCISIGLCTALVWNFLFWHLEDLSAKHAGCEGNSIKTLEGFVMAVQCFGGELPFFFLSGWILKKIGHVNSMSLVLLGFAARFILYSFLDNPWYVLPIELLDGVTFGMFYSTMASYASIVAPAGSEATLQGLVGAIFEGVGVSIGSSLGGIMFNSIGGSKTFLIFGLGALVASLVHTAVQWVLATNYKDSATAKYAAPNDAMHMLDEQEYYIVP